MLCICDGVIFWQKQFEESTGNSIMVMSRDGMNHMPVNGLMPPTCRACRGPSYKRFGSLRVASAIASPLVNWGSGWQFGARLL